MSKYKKDKDGFIILNKIPKERLQSNDDMFSNIDDLIALDNDELINIGDYVYDKGIIHCLNLNLGRSIPSIYDGLKSVERRILFCMHQMKLYPNRPRTKTSSIVGRLIETSYPHGDAAPAETIARLGKPFQMMIPYIDKQGSFGDLATNRASAPRYTEARLSEYAMECFFSEEDVPNKIYDTKDNYNYTGVEPVYIASKYPNILMQWNNGIGKGAYASIPAFNSKDIFKTTIQMLDDPFVPVDIFPDTPIELDIINKSELKGCFDQSEFKIKLRSKYYTDVWKNRDNTEKYVLVFTTCPMSTNGELLKEAICRIKEEDMKRSVKRFPEIIDVNSASDGVSKLKFIIEYEKGYDPDVLAEKLYKSTSFATTIGAKLTMVKDNKTYQFTPRQVLMEWISARYDQKRRYYHQKSLKASMEVIVCDAILIVINNDAVVDLTKIIKTSDDDSTMIKNIMKRFPEMNELQAVYLSTSNIKVFNKKNTKDLKERRNKAAKDYDYYKSLCYEDNIKDDIRKDLQQGLAKYGKPRIAKLMNLKNTQGDPNDKKIIVYSKDTYYCLDSYDSLPTIASKIDKSYDMVKVTNSDTVMIFGAKGVIKILDGYSFNYTTDGISLSNMAFNNVVKILCLSKNVNDVALVTTMGYGKRMNIAECVRNVKGKVINLNDDDTLSYVIPVKNDGLVCMIDGDKLYYVKADAIPSLKRGSYGNKLIKTDTNITHAMYIDNSIPYILIYGESGYVKVLDTRYLGFSKKGSDCITMSGKVIFGIVPLVSDVSDLNLYDNNGKIQVNVDIKDKITFSCVLSDKTNVKSTFPMSTSIGNSVKVLKKTKNEFYKIK